MGKSDDGGGGGNGNRNGQNTDIFGCKFIWVHLHLVVADLGSKERAIDLTVSFLF
jgi:hypothetical protein